MGARLGKKREMNIIYRIYTEQAMYNSKRLRKNQEMKSRQWTLHVRLGNNWDMDIRYRIYTEQAMENGCKVR